MGSAAIDIEYSPEEFKRRLVKWVVLDDQPFSAVESPRVWSLFSLFTADVSFPSADTIKREIMKCYQEEEVRIRGRLRAAGSKISVTLDCWTSPNVKAFLGITGHYIDNNWTSHSLILAFAPLLGRHSGEDLCEAFTTACDRLEILPKLLGVTTDNASNNDNFLFRFEGVCKSRDIVFDKKEQHMRCIAHVTNLAVQALLRKLRAEVSEADLDNDNDSATRSEQFSCIAKLHYLVVKIRSSPQRRNEFKSHCDACRAPQKELVLDVRTRWAGIPPTP
jgi:hypothetical protein